MRILVAAATAAEIAPLVARLGRVHDQAPRRQAFHHGAHHIDLLTTGVGMVATAAWCSRALAEARYDLALNAGVCGAFDPSLPLASVVHIVEDRVAELGAEDGPEFLPIEALRLPAPDGDRFAAADVVNRRPPDNAVLAALPAVRGITVNTVHGRDETIADAVLRWRPHVESMEGAAFMSACLIAAVPFAQVRAISNRVERRNRASWKLADAIDSLAETMIGVLETL